MSSITVRAPLLLPTSWETPPPLPLPPRPTNQAITPRVAATIADTSPDLSTAAAKSATDRPSLAKPSTPAASWCAPGLPRPFPPRSLAP
jgi:hypothetical protein